MARQKFLGSIGVIASGLVVAACSSGGSSASNTTATTAASSTSAHAMSGMTELGSGFNNPSSVAVDGSGNVFVVDTGNNRVVEITSTGKQTTVGSGFHSPSAVAVDPFDNVYVAQFSGCGCQSPNNAVYKISPGGTQTTVASGYWGPEGVAYCNGSVYVADPGSNQVFDVAPDGTQTNVGSGYNAAYGVAVDKYGAVYVSTDASTGPNNNVGGVDNVTELSTDGHLSTIGSGWKQANAIALAPTDPINVYVADSGNNRVEEVTPDGVQTAVGSGFSGPSGVAVDPSGNVYVADSGNSRVVKVAARGSGGSTAGATTTAPSAPPSTVAAAAPAAGGPTVALPTPTGGGFLNLDADVYCEVTDNSTVQSVSCEAASKQDGVTMAADGSLKKCSGSQCFRSSTAGAVTISNGSAVVLSPFRCVSVDSNQGVTCTVASGKGFTIAGSLGGGSPSYPTGVTAVG